VVAFGLLVAAAADLPVGVGAAIIGAFALLHGHAHGSEIPQTAGGMEYAAGFALATASLHILGIGIGLTFGTRFRTLVRAAGAVVALIGVGLALGVAG
jgi:urease accessory protein